MKASAVAPANIAFIKYWGKVDPEVRVPRNSSVSMNLSEMFTTTTVEFKEPYTRDEISFLGETEVRREELDRISSALNKIREKTGTRMHAKVVTRNTFPKAAGIASSASGFASLATAAFAALDISLPEKEMSMFCRTLSGTAARSIPDGFVQWQKGIGPDDSYAYQLFPPDYWDIRDVVTVVTKSMKKIGSTEGHAVSGTSPFYRERMKGMVRKVAIIRKAMTERDFSAFGEIIEAEALNMHAICLTSSPALIYWEPATLRIMKTVISLREAGEIESYFTIDAGPTVYVICKADDAPDIAGRLKKISGVLDAVINRPARGAHITNTHLF